MKSGLVNSVKSVDPQILRMLFSAAFLVVMALMGCSGSQLALESESPTPVSANSTSVAAPALLKTAQPAAIIGTPEIKTPTRLVVWLPEEFNLQNANLAENMMKEQLQKFLTKNQDVVVELRVKREDGAHSILSLLALTSKHAADALPDVVLMRAEEARAAKRRELLPSSGIFNSNLEEDDWYPYARVLSDSRLAGDCIPLAGDATALIVNADSKVGQSLDWNEVVRSRISLTIPGLDPHQSFLKFLMLSNGGQIARQDGLLQINPDSLVETMNQMLQMVKSETVDPASLDLSAEREVRILLEQKAIDAAPLQISNLLQNPNLDARIIELVDTNNIPVVSASGWVWCVQTVDPERQALSMTYIRWMTDPDFLRVWSPASGYLPVRPSSLTGWKNSGFDSVVEQFALHARIFEDLGFAPEIEDIFLSILPEIFSGIQDAAALTDMINSQVQLIHD